MIQTQENGDKPNFGLDSGPLRQIPAVNFFFENLAL